MNEKYLPIKFTQKWKLISSLINVIEILCITFFFISQYSLKFLQWTCKDKSYFLRVKRKNFLNTNFYHSNCAQLFFHSIWVYCTLSPHWWNITGKPQPCHFYLLAPPRALGRRLTGSWPLSVESLYHSSCYT